MAPCPLAYLELPFTNHLAVQQFCLFCSYAHAVCAAWNCRLDSIATSDDTLHDALFVLFAVVPNYIDAAWSWSSAVEDKVCCANSVLSILVLGATEALASCLVITILNRV